MNRPFSINCGLQDFRVSRAEGCFRLIPSATYLVPGYLPCTKYLGNLQRSLPGGSCSVLSHCSFRLIGRATSKSGPENFAPIGENAGSCMQLLRHLHSTKQMLIVVGHFKLEQITGCYGRGHNIYFGQEPPTLRGWLTTHVSNEGIGYIAYLSHQSVNGR